ncbi:MAG: hypothetical protein LUH00_09930 [Lachnospiraceae bacterium]|nr:hypothetical protein [Lachnospiraceae bacterium]
MDKRNLLLYVDILFCPVHCKHCGKIACAPGSDLRYAYAQALRKEIAASADSLPDYEISAVYIGGGISGHMMDEELGELLKDLSSWYNIAPDAEITLKVHPGMVSVETLNACRRGHVTRLSMEYVTHNSFESEMLGRFLSPSAMDVTHMILGASRLDLSFDIIAGLPGQTRASLLESIKKALSYGASHFSLYPFVLTPGTELAEEYIAKQNSATAFRSRKKWPSGLQMRRITFDHRALRNTFRGDSPFPGKNAGILYLNPMDVNLSPSDSAQKAPLTVCGQKIRPV